MLVAGRQIFGDSSSDEALSLPPAFDRHVETTRVETLAMNSHLLLRRLRRTAGVKGPEDAARDDAVPVVSPPPVEEQPQGDSDEYYYVYYDDYAGTTEQPEGEENTFNKYTKKVADTLHGRCRDREPDIDPLTFPTSDIFPGYHYLRLCNLVHGTNLGLRLWYGMGLASCERAFNYVIERLASFLNSRRRWTVGAR